LLTAAADAGFRQMIAVVSADEQASVALHAGLGFRHTGRLPAVGRKFGRWLDTAYMQIALGAGDREPPAREPQ
jgi:phosphinothricin acetyltransferase